VNPSVRSKIESETLRLIDKYNTENGLSIQIPIPVLEIIESIGFNYDFRMDGVYKDKDLLGGLHLDSKTIVINEQIAGQDGRMHFTAAHELGHLILHANENKKCKEIDNNPKDDKNIEMEADLFASFLLMPTSSVKEAFFKVRKSPLKMTDHRFFGLIKKKRSRKERAMFIANKIKKIGGFENVSKLAFLNRLIGMNLIKGISYQSYRNKPKN
jgi:Zn-dependent peptidase ImmA (M78 family)